VYFFLGFPRTSNLAQLLQNNSVNEMNMLWKKLKRVNPDFSQREFVFSSTSAFFMKSPGEEI
jgi:hypothetical protein